MKAKELTQLIELLYEKGFSEFEIERKGFRMRLSRSADTNSSSRIPSQPLIVASPIPVPLALSSGNAAQDNSAIDHAPPQPVVERESKGTAQPAEVELHIIKSPIVGTFFRAASPTSDPFVRIGDQIDQDSVVCIIEAMKLMNEIQAEVSGEVVKCYVENGQPVEYGQKLFGIKT